MLKYLKMVNFRNYKEAELSLDKGSHFFIGANGQGKSNFLEAVYYSGTGSSFRFAREEDMVLWKKPFFYLKAVVKEEEEESETLEIGYEAARKRKVIKINNKKKKAEQLLELFPIIYFVPDDLSLVKGSPVQRRRFLDTEIYRISPLYREDLQNYKKVLQQRNRLLKYTKEVSVLNEELSSWNEQLIHFGSRLLLQRIKIVDKLNLLARLAYRRIAADSSEELSLFYSSSLAPAYNFSKVDLSLLRDLFHKKLLHSFKEEKRRGTTLVGPHRDDLIILLSKRDARRFSSQGQQRSIVLALKIAEIELFRSEKNKEPLLILDDVFSELDKKRSDLFLKSCNSLKQVFITATDSSIIPPFILSEKNNYIFSIKGGHITT